MNPPIPTSERLAHIHPFGPSILERVGDVADQQAGLTYAEFIEKNNIPDVQIYTPPTGKPVEVLDMIPRDGYERTFVYHEGMAYPINPNTIVHIAAIALSTLPGTRVIGFGNPGGRGHGYGRVRFADLPAVWKGNLGPVVHSRLQYIEQIGVERVEHVGASLGADLAVASARYASWYGHQASKLALIDPSVAPAESMAKLGLRYETTEEHVDAAVNATQFQPYLQARTMSPGLVDYIGGIMRPNNLAIAHLLARSGFGGRLGQALVDSPETRAHFVWASGSEIALDDSMMDLMQQTQASFGTERVGATRIVGKSHAHMCDDIFLLAASTHHALTQ